MVYKITLSGFRAFCTVRTAKTKPINNISILWGKHHLRTLCCDEGHSCCRKGCIPFTTIVLCCFYHVNVNQYFSSSQEYVHVHYSPNYFTCMPLMFNIYPNFFFIYFFVIKNITMILINIKLQGNFDKWFHKSRITLSPQINKLCPLSHNNIVFFLLWVLDL